MLKVSIKDNEQLVHSESTLETLLFEVSYVISVLHGRIQQSRPEMADEFRRTLLLALIDPKSPVWDYDPAQSNGFSACIPIKKKGELNHDGSQCQREMPRSAASRYDPGVCTEGPG